MTEENDHSAAALALVAAWMVVTMLLWWFALYPTSETSPEWVIRARAVCFGTDETGLPDTYGWWVLILSPLSLLLAFVITYGRELRAGGARLFSSLSGQVVVVVMLSLAVVQIGWATGRIQEGIAISRIDYGPDGTLPWPESYPRTDTPVPAFSLTDQHGSTVSPADLEGKVVILTFAFAHCTTVCPVIVQTSQKAFVELPPEDTRLVVITLDPWRDTPRSLPSLAKKWSLGEGTHVLSGEVADVLKTIEDFKIPTEKNEKSGDITHPALIFVIDQEKQIAYTFNNPPQSWLKQAVHRLLGSKEA